MHGDRSIRAYGAQYADASKQNLNNDLAGCIETAKYNLKHPTLPPFYKLMNSRLLAEIIADWEKAKDYYVAAEDAYRECFNEAQKSPEHEQAWLIELKNERVQLDDLIQRKKIYAH